MWIVDDAGRPCSWSLIQCEATDPNRGVGDLRLQEVWPSEDYVHDVQEPERRLYAGREQLQEFSRALGEEAMFEIMVESERR